MIEDLPGYLGWTSRGVIAIHADWPAYSLEHGWEFALETLAQFPADTRFSRIDQIDRCSLFVVEDFRADLGEFDDRRFHVAVWNEDLLDLGDKGLISGVERITERENERRYREILRKSILEQPDSSVGLPDVDPLDNLYAMVGDKRIPIRLPPLSTYDGACSCPCDCDLNCDCHENCSCEEGCEPLEKTWPGTLVDNNICVTGAGWKVLSEIYRGPNVGIAPGLDDKFEHLMQKGYFDTTVRELSVHLESEMRAAVGGSTYGMTLVREYFEALERSGVYIGSYLKVLKLDVRSAFKFVRNEFAHNVVELDEVRALALAGRMSRLLLSLKSVNDGVDLR